MDQIGALEARLAQAAAEGDALKTQTLVSMLCCNNANCIYTGGDGGPPVQSHVAADPMVLGLEATPEAPPADSAPKCCSGRSCSSSSQPQPQQPSNNNTTATTTTTNQHLNFMDSINSGSSSSPFNPSIANTPTPSDTSEATIKFPTSFELYGPMEIESTVIALKQIPSLHACPAVDEMCSLLVQHSQIGDSKTARKHLIKMARTTMQVFDACTIVDRMKAVEVFSLFQQRNSTHVKYFDQFLVSTKPRVRSARKTADPPRLKSLKESMKAIPSLAEAQDIIDEFCDVLWKDQGIPTDDESGENFFIIRELQAKLEEKCDVEDRTKFWLLFEAVREGKRKEMDSLISRVEASEDFH
ncbi:hypothetical protein BDR26DRAFT_873336 [Obelidium mucronatum]|nr:hypothetical protein BDR26DRAFT_873336 [Obelidium mucronatum]